MKLCAEVARVRKRSRRWRVIFIWLLLGGFAFVTLALSDLFDRSAGPPRRPPRKTPAAPVLAAGWRDGASELVADFGPLGSLREDQLLPVPVPRRRRGFGDPSGAPASQTRRRDAEAKVRVHEDRSGPGDQRSPMCSREPYRQSLPSASVVICFHDETRSALLRTVHSVLDTSPKRYLRELLLVDGSGQQGQNALREHVSNLDGVRLIRGAGSSGIGGCRSSGASRAAGEVLVFMDSNCQCHRGWLEPLLERVAQDRTTVVSPIMDVIDGRTFRYDATRWPVRGVFDWRLEFQWESNVGVQVTPPDPGIRPIRSPALGGGVLAIDKHFFQSVGAYDPGMQQRGGEHVEFSIRVWSCGGTMEVVPCSRVARLQYQEFPVPDQEPLERNKIRLADTWMDGYRKIFYRRDTLAHSIRQSESPNVTERLRLKKNLGCRNFRWYLTTVYPQLYIPQDRPGLSGQLYNVGTGSCVDFPRGNGPPGGFVHVAPCSGTGGQHCDLNLEGQVRWGPRGDLCLDAAGKQVRLSPCNKYHHASNALRWNFLKLSGQLVHQPSQLCLEAVKGGENKGGHPEEAAGRLFLHPCVHRPRQQWHFEQLVAPGGT